MNDTLLHNAIDYFFGDDPSAPMRRAIALGVLAAGLALVWSALSRRGWDPYTKRKRSFPEALILRFIALALVAVCLHLQINTIVRERKFRLMEDTLYLPNARTVRMVAVGYDELLADVLFLRAIQAYGGGWQFSGKGGRPKLFEHYFNIITDLDPHFTRAYTFGNLLIGEEMRAPAPAMGLLAKGTFLNPEHYRVSYEAGFFAVDRLDDYPRGAHYLRWAVEAPDVPSWVARQIDYFAIRQGRYEIGYRGYLRMYLDSLINNNHIEERIARARLDTTMDDWAKGILIGALAEFRSERGTYPTRLDELERGGYFGTYRIADTALLDVVDPETGLTPIDWALALNLALDDRAERLMETITIESQGLPPTSDRRGWFYANTGNHYNLEKVTDTLMDQLGALAAYREVLSLETSLTGMAPPDFLSLLRSVSDNPYDVAVPDARGTFLFYNPQTATVDYVSSHWD